MDTTRSCINKPRSEGFSVSSIEKYVTQVSGNSIFKEFVTAKDIPPSISLCKVCFWETSFI